MAVNRDFNDGPTFDDLDIDEDTLAKATGAMLNKLAELDLGVDVIAIELAPNKQFGTLTANEESRGRCPPGYIMVNGRCVRRP